jgi:hypothetical protein
VDRLRREEVDPVAGLVPRAAGVSADAPAEQRRTLVNGGLRGWRKAGQARGRTEVGQACFLRLLGLPFVQPAMRYGPPTPTARR